MILLLFTLSPYQPTYLHIHPLNPPPPLKRNGNLCNLSACRDGADESRAEQGKQIGDDSEKARTAAGHLRHVEKHTHRTLLYAQV